jgi:hypothetical protein
MVAVPPHTAPGNSRPGCASTCPQAHPVKPSPDDGVYHQNPLRPPPEERVMAPHQGHRTVPPRCPLWLSWSPRGILPPTSLSLRQSLRLPTSRRSLQLYLAPARCHICTYKQTTDSINIYIINIWMTISKNTQPYISTSSINIPR